MDRFLKAVRGWIAGITGRRERRLCELAGRLRFEFHETDPFELAAGPLRAFHVGEGGWCENVMWGDVGTSRVVAFDYSYTAFMSSRSGQTTSTVRLSCAMTQIDASMPRVVLVPRTQMDAVKDLLDGDEIEFESEEFNEAWCVKAQDRKAASDLVDARLMDWLLEAKPNAAFEVFGSNALCYAALQATGGVETLIEWAGDFHRLVPALLGSLYPSESEQTQQ